MSERDPYTVPWDDWRRVGWRGLEAAIAPERTQRDRHRTLLESGLGTGRNLRGPVVVRSEEEFRRIFGDNDGGAAVLQTTGVRESVEQNAERQRVERKARELGDTPRRVLEREAAYFDSEAQRHRQSAERAEARAEERRQDADRWWPRGIELSGGPRKVLLSVRYGGMLIFRSEHGIRLCGAQKNGDADEYCMRLHGHTVGPHVYTLVEPEWTGRDKGSPTDGCGPERATIVDEAIVDEATRVSVGVETGEDPSVGVFVWVCELCGQPLRQGEECNSAAHVGPHGGPRGRAIRSTDLAAAFRSAQGEHCILCFKPLHGEIERLPDNCLAHTECWRNASPESKRAHGEIMWPG